MTAEFRREERYLVFKLSDVEEHFTPGEKQQLARLVEVQRVGREEAGKPLLRCVVVESDWPEYEPTWRAIEARVTGAQAQPAPSMLPVKPAPQPANPESFDAALWGAIAAGMITPYHLGPAVPPALDLEAESVSFIDTSQLESAVSTEIVPSYPPPSGWLRAIDEALVVAHIGVANADDTYEQAKAKLERLIGFHVDAATDPAVNGGYKLVPIEPTEEMREVGVFAGGAYYDVVEAVYEAMLTAAPEAKP